MPRYVRGLPRAPETQEMRDGTAVHEVTRLCLECGYQPQDLVGRIVKGVFIVPEMARAVEPWVARGRAHQKAGAKTWVEYRFSLAKFHPLLFGTVDFAAYYPATRHLFVDDLKYGAGIFVAVERNLQGMGYSLGAMTAVDGRVDKVTIGIDQPRREDVDGDAYRTWDTTPAELLELGLELAASVQLGQKPDAAFTPGLHCQLCPGRGSCEALRDYALRAAGADSEPYSGSFMPPPPPESLSRNELGRVKSQADIIRIWLNGVEQLADSEARRGNVAVGWKLARTLGNRAWKDGDLAMRQAARQFPGEVTEDELWERKALSPAKLEKLLGKAHVADFVEANVTRPEGVALVPLDDPRPAYSSADDEFEPIDANPGVAA